MNLEIERKFLITKPEEYFASFNRNKINQAYIFQDVNMAFRVWIKNDKNAKICFKQKIDDLTRKEYEYEIPIEDAKQLYNDCLNKIEKTRYYIQIENNLTFEVDFFRNNLSGLSVAEIELPNSNVNFSKPEWLGEEITSDYRYLNSVLSVNGLPK